MQVMLHSLSPRLLINPSSQQGSFTFRQYSQNPVTSPSKLQNPSSFPLHTDESLQKTGSSGPSSGPSSACPMGQSLACVLCNSTVWSQG